MKTYKTQLFLISLMNVISGIGCFAEGNSISSLNQNNQQITSAPNNTIHLTVDSACAYALKNSTSLKSAAIDLEIKKRASDISFNALLPTVQVSGTMTRSNTYSTTYATLLNPLYKGLGIDYRLPTSAANEADYWTALGSVSASVSWNLSIIQNIKQSHIAYEAGQITFADIQRQTEQSVKKMFYSLLLQTKYTELQNTSLADSAQRYTQTLKEYNEGTVPKLKLLQNEVSYENMKSDVTKQQQSFAQQLDQFAFILGIPEGTEIILEGTFDIPFVTLNESDLINTYLDNNSEVQLIKKNSLALDSQSASIDLSTFTPTFSFGYATKPYLSDIESNWFSPDNWSDTGNFNCSIGWNLTNLLPFSTTQQKKKDIAAQKAKLQISLEETERKTKLEVKKLVDQVEQSHEAIIVAVQNSKLALQSYTLTQEAYENGSAELLEVKEAQTQLMKAQLGEQESRYNYIAALIDIEYTLNLPKGWLEETK